MIGKMVKYTKSLLRIIILKIKFRNKIQFKFKNIKSLYIGKSVRIKIDKGNKLVLGQNVYIDDFCRVYCIGGDVQVGNNVYINTNCNIMSLAGINLGNDCLLGSNVGIYDHDHCYTERDVPIRMQGFSLKKVNLADNIWVGSNCTITKGVEIDSKVIIAANSVVTKILKESGVYAGVPCKIIKSI